MKIALNTRFLIDGALEGVGWFTYEVFSRLVKSLPEHQFYFFFDRPYDSKFIFESNVTPIVLKPPARHPFLWYLWFEQVIPRALKKYEIDLFISPDGFCSLSTNVKQIMVVHDIAFEHFPDNVDFLKQRYFRRYSPKYCNKADHILTVSNFSKKDLINQYKIDPQKISVAHNGINDNFFPVSKELKKQMIADFGGEYFLYVGALHPRKNIAKLLEAFDRFKLLTKRKHKLVIVGRKAWGNKHMESVYKKMKALDDVIFKGHANQESLNAIYGGACALIYPSLFEGFGLPVLEAMKCGIPVITTEHSSMSEICEDAAIYVNPLDIDDMANALARVLKENECRKMIAMGVEKATKFSWDKTTKVMVDVVKNLSK